MTIRKAKIYKPVKSAMQSGRAKDEWVLEYQKHPEFKNFNYNLTGWVGNKDPLKTIKLKFSSQAQAEEYAKNNKILYKLIIPKPFHAKRKSYADNFK